MKIKVKTTKCVNLKKWAMGMVCGTVSYLTCCCFCCGCAGKIKAPAVLYDDEDPVYVHAQPNEKQIVHSVNWCGLAGMACKCIPLCCGCCCGCCGIVSPSEGIMMIAETKKTHPHRN